MTEPRLLLIDDEPALADFLASAARECGFDPEITGTTMSFESGSSPTGRRWSRSTLECREWTVSS